MSNSVAVVILCAGPSKRFKANDNKLTYLVKGVPLIKLVVKEILQFKSDETIVVQGPIDLSSYFPDWVTIISNEHYENGLASSVNSALDYCQRQGHNSAIFTFGSEYPVSCELLERVVEVPSLVVYPTYRNQPYRPVKIDASLWPVLPIDSDNEIKIFHSFDHSVVSEIALTKPHVVVKSLSDIARIEAML